MLVSRLAVEWGVSGIHDISAIKAFLSTWSEVIRARSTLGDGGKRLRPLNAVHEPCKPTQGS
jgi:hypothetical protein